MRLPLPTVRTGRVNIVSRIIPSGKLLLRKLLEQIKVGGLEVEFWDGQRERFGPEAPQGRLIFKDRGVVAELLQDPSVAFGEAYADGRIEADDLAACLDVLYRNRELYEHDGPQAVAKLVARMAGRHRPARQRQQIRHHYDLGNDFFSQWLDPTNTYSCAYFKSAEDTLEQAQRQKVEHVLSKLHLQPGLRLLDIGCGWGALILRAAKHGVTSLGITLSQEQYAAVCSKIAERGVEQEVSVREQDYREVEGQFDRIASVGMFEHVGRENYPVFFSRLRDLLRPGGVALLHTITRPREQPADAWIRKHIFPGGCIPSLREIISQLPRFDLRVQDVENLRPHYAMTLDRWRANFEHLKDDVCERYGKNFFRTWRLYLTGSAVAFRTGTLEIHQVLISRGTTADLPLARTV